MAYFGVMCPAASVSFSNSIGIRRLLTEMVYTTAFVIFDKSLISACLSPNLYTEVTAVWPPWGCCEVYRNVSAALQRPPPLARGALRVACPGVPEGWLRGVARFSWKGWNLSPPHAGHRAGPPGPHCGKRGNGARRGAGGQRGSR